MRTTVRNKELEHKFKHLLELPGAKERLKIFEADLTTPGSYRECFEGCTGVLHTATSVAIGEGNAENVIYKPGV